MIVLKIVFVIMTLILVFKIYIKIRNMIAWYKFKKSKKKYLKLFQENEDLKKRIKVLTDTLNFE